jgi:hypothetical protein
MAKWICSSPTIRERNYLYINKGDGTFDDQSYVSGFAFNFDGREIASMGLAVGDYLNNGLVDVLDTDFSDDYKALYRNDGNANFTDVSREAGFAQIAVPFVGWGDGLIDYDNDGWKDMMMINGHVYPQVDEHDWGTTYAQRPLAVSQQPPWQVRIRAAGEGLGAGHSHTGARRCIRRPLQQRQNRCRHQPCRRATRAAEECEPGPSPLGGAQTGRRPEKPARCDRCYRLFDRERDAPA